MYSHQAVSFDPHNSNSNPESRSPSNQKSTTHWKDIVHQYEKRNASLEHRQAQLSERLRAMECTLPSMLMSAMVSMHYGTEPPRMDLESVLSKSGVTSDITNPTGSGKAAIKPDGLQVELVYKRPEDFFDPNQQIPEPEGVGKAENQSVGNSRFATGDDGRLNHERIGTADPGARETAFGQSTPSTDSVINLSVMSSRDLMALGRIQELAEQERLLKRYICDLESRERTFCETLERANRLLNDPLECVEGCVPICFGAEAKEPLSDDPVMQRLQKLEFYNKRMITSMKGLRQEKNVLIKQTELLKAQLRNTQEKLGEVQKEVLGEGKVIPIMGEPSLTKVKATCSCASTTNKDNSSGQNANPKTLSDLAEQFEDVLQKAKNHGLCKLSGTIKVAAMKLKELSKSEEGYNKCICNCPCDPVFKQDGPCPNCKCGKFDMDILGETGDWFCDSCGGECVCDLVSLDEDSLETNHEKSEKTCQCGCQNDKIACECGCVAGISNTNEVREAGDIPKTVARKLSEDLKDIICKDCGNCKCGDDHSNCPNCIEACTCSCTTKTVISSLVPELLLKPEKQLGQMAREPQDPDACGPRCPCNDSGNANHADGAPNLESNFITELKKKFVISSAGKRGGNADLHPCFECEQSEPCDVCLEEEFSRLEQPKTIVHSGLQESLLLKSIPCKECLGFGTKLKKEGVKMSAMCNLCETNESRTFQDSKTKVIESKDSRSAGDETKAQKIHDQKCPCSCDETVSSNAADDQCLCGCGVSARVIEKKEDSCPCGCGQIVGISDAFQESGCDCECAKGGVHCDYCCCVESIVELLNTDKIAYDKSPEICPCIEDSVREAEIENLAKTLQQDVDCIGKRNNVLRQLVAQCASAAPEIVQESCPTDGCPYHDPTPIRPTMSGLQAAIELLRVKNRSKDGMIAVLAENLGGKVDTGRIIEKLSTSTPTEILQDFDQCRLYNYLQKGSEFKENSIPNQRKYVPPRATEDQGSRKSTSQTKNSDISWFRSAIPPPRDFKVVKQICNDCLLVTWTQPDDISMLNGYELRVNGYVANRIGSPTRTEALLISLDTSRPVLLTLYSLGPGGSSSDPVRITYPACPCSVDD